jgi:hypothetical protein
VRVTRLKTRQGTRRLIPCNDDSSESEQRSIDEQAFSEDWDFGRLGITSLEQLGSPAQSREIMRFAGSNLVRRPVSYERVAMMLAMAC